MKKRGRFLVIILLLRFGRLFATNNTDTGKAPGPVMIKMNYAGTDNKGAHPNKEMISFFAAGAERYLVSISNPGTSGSWFDSFQLPWERSKIYQNLDEHSAYQFQVTAINAYGSTKSEILTRAPCTDNLIITPNPTTDSISIRSAFGESFVFKEVMITWAKYGKMVARIPFYSGKSAVVIYLGDYKIQQGVNIVTATDTSGRSEIAEFIYNPQ